MKTPSNFRIAASSKLGELAALAAAVVDGFVRPRYDNIASVDWQGERPFDDSPAALAMAVMVFTANPTSGLGVGIRSYARFRAEVCYRGDGEPVVRTLEAATPEAIARAYIVTMLQANGVEVTDD